MASIPAQAEFQSAELHQSSVPANRAKGQGGEQKLSSWRLAGFASIAVPVAGAGLPLSIFVPQLYATEFGLSLAVIGLIFLFGRIWDIAADPIIGVLSDRTRTRFGRRRPWIAAGGVLFGLSSALLFFPPAHLVSPLYLSAVLFVFYLAWTMVEIPTSAWTGELSTQYHGRTRVVGYQSMMRAIGLLAVLVLPTILDQFQPSNGTLKLQLVGGFILITLVPTLLLSLFTFQEAPLPKNLPAPDSLWRTTTLIFTDKLLLRVLVSDVLVTMGQSIRAGLIVFFAVWYMGLPAWASGLYLLQFVFGVFAAPIWLRVGYRLGKRRTAIAGELVQAAINASLIFVVPGALPLLIALTIAQGLSQGSGNMMLRAMVADVSDAHRLRTGHDRTGLFFSVFALSAKLGPAIGVGIALPLIAFAGFAPGPNNNPEALESLKYVFALGPALAHILATLVIWRFPLNETAHADIRRALNQRDAAQTA